MIYLDTSALISFYLQRKHTEKIRHEVAKFEGPILINQLILAEFESAVYQLNLSQSQIQWFKTHLFTEIELGRLVVEKPDWHVVLQKTTEFLTNAEGKIRTMDATHIAAALIQEADVFITADQKQFNFSERVLRQSILAIEL